jgi:hypothetical protein
MNIYEVILFAAVIGNAWSNVLTEEGHIFDFIRKFVNKLEVKYNKDLSKVFCVFCMSGQVGLWWGVFRFWIIIIPLDINGFRCYCFGWLH